MVAVNSQMLPLGTQAPPFSLPDTDGKMVTLSANAADRPDARGFLVMFICNHCPYVKHVAGQIAAIGHDYGNKRVAIFAINANDAEKHPDDGVAGMKAEKAARGYAFPYLVDESQAIAKAYRAACTPDFFLFDRERKLVYRGQLDGARPRNDVPVDGADMRRALDDLLAGRAITPDQKPSIGCNIKWKPGNAPAYFG